MGKELYNKSFIKDMKLKREIKALAPLLQNIKEEEPSIMSLAKKRNIKINYKTSFLAISNVQIYKTYTILGLLSDYKTNTKYFVIDLGILLDVWFNNSSLIDKSRLLSCDILIVKGKALAFQSETKATALIELIGSRKALNKVTWLFMENTTLNEFNTLYPDVKSSLGIFYQITFTNDNKNNKGTDTGDSNDNIEDEDVEDEDIDDNDNKSDELEEYDVNE